MYAGAPLCSSRPFLVGGFGVSLEWIGGGGARSGALMGFGRARERTCRGDGNGALDFVVLFGSHEGGVGDEGCG